MALRMIIEVDDRGKSVVKSFTDTTVKQVKKVETQTATTTRRMSQSWSGVRDTLGKIRMAHLAVVGAIVAAGAAISKTVGATVQYRDEITKLSRATGFSTEALVGFTHAAEIGGASQESLTRGIRSLFRRMQDVKDGLLEGKRMFDQINVSVLKTDGSMRKGREVFLDVADALSGMESSTEKAALAQEIFGRGGLELVPMLDTGRRGIEKLMVEADLLGRTFTEVEGKQAEDFQDAMTRVGKSVKGVRDMLVSESGLVPALTQTALAITAGVMYLGQYKSQLQTVIEGVLPGIQSLRALTNLFKKKAEATGKATEGTKTYWQIGQGPQ